MCCLDAAPKVKLVVESAGINNLKGWWLTDDEQEMNTC
jgi:hypothetical protein